MIAGCHSVGAALVKVFPDSFEEALFVLQFGEKRLGLGVAQARFVIDNPQSEISIFGKVIACPPARDIRAIAQADNAIQAQRGARGEGALQFRRGDTLCVARGFGAVKHALEAFLPCRETITPISAIRPMGVIHAIALLQLAAQARFVGFREVCQTGITKHLLRESALHLKKIGVRFLIAPHARGQSTMWAYPLVIFYITFISE